MEERDLNSVLKIERLSFPNPWRLTTFIGELYNYPISVAYVIDHILNKNVVGYIILWFLQEQVQISNFAIHPDYRKAGLGQTVLNHVLNKVKHQGAREIFLEVRPSNQAAIALYKKLGFEVLGREENYYRSPEEDALIMGKNFV